MTESGESVLVSDRSTEGLTVVVAVAELLPVLGSVSLPLTEAVLLRDGTAAAVGVTTIVADALAPLFRLPRLQPIVVVPLQLPWLEATETNVTLAGSVSVTVTPVAVNGPLLVTLIV